MQPEYQVSDLVPHSGKMSLLDEIVEYDQESLRAMVHLSDDSMFVQPEGVPAWIGMEYMAQAIAAFAGLQQRRNGGAPKLGFLLGSRKYVSSVDFFRVGQSLTVHVIREMQAENGLHAFDCRLTGDGVDVSARMTVFQPDNAEQFLQDM